MKKILTLLLALVMACSLLASCVNSGKGNNNDNKPPVTGEPETPDTPENPDDPGETPDVPETPDDNTNKPNIDPDGWTQT